MARAIPVLANLAIAALFLLCSVRATGQDKLTAFFDPDETNTRATEVVDALKVICPQGEIARNGQGYVAGCVHCPQQTAERNSEDLNWELKRTFSGHFTAAKEDNILITGRGCEPHSGNFGGTFVFTVKGTAVSYLRYNEALITERCHKFQTKNAQDLLICTDDWGAQVTQWSYIYQVGFGRNGASNVKHIFEVVDMSRQTCGINFFDDSPTSVQGSHITGLEFSNPTGRPPILSITASLGERTPSDQERKACQQGTPIPLTLETYGLDFVFEGNAFRPSAKTKPTLRLFPKPESPDESFSTNH